MDLLGGGISNYLRNPGIFSWLNFDGEHYLLITQNGYSPLNYFYFPLYPLLIRTISSFTGNGVNSLAINGLFVSNVSFFVGLVGLAKLVRLDYSKDIVRLTLILLITFPTSFYFGSYYTESLFFALTIWSFYFTRRGNWLLSGVLGGLSTATRIVGLALIPAFFVEAFLKGNLKGFKDFNWMKILGILLIPTGLVVYMFYLKQQAGDPLEFLHSVGTFGEQRSSSFVMLPQVFYRYIVKIIPNINNAYFPAVFTIWLEFIVASLFGGLAALGVLVGFRKQKKLKFRLSYSVFLIIGYLIPTLSGSFSSLPRYVLVLFPAYLLSAIYFKSMKKYIQYAILAILLICMWVATSFFVRGYWIA